MDIFMIISLLGGLGLFLYGMHLMANGLELAAGDRLRRWLELLTKNRFAGLAVGTGVTAIIQSSSATTVMVIGFVNAGMMSLSQAISVGMGANIGTTITGQLIAFKLTDIAPLALFIGILMMLFFKKGNVQRIGQIIGGFGILFVGMNLMSESMTPLKDWEPFVNMLSNFQNPALGILAGLVFTAIIQSSSATLGILQAMAMQGILGLDSAVYVILGMNIGTCVTALIASLGSNKTAKRTAVAHIAFNVIGTIVFSILLAILPITDWVKMLSPGDPVRQLANFHTIFNVVTTLLLIWWPGLLIKISNLVIRGQDPERSAKTLKYIVPNQRIENSAVAVGQAFHEIQRMADIAFENYKLSMQAFLNSDDSLIKTVEDNEQVVNYLEHEITDFLTKVSQEDLNPNDSKRISEMFHIVMDRERISDHAENIGEAASRRVEQKIAISQVGTEELTQMNSKVSLALDKCYAGLSQDDKKAAEEVIAIEQQVDDLEILLKENHIKRLAKQECTAKASMIFADLITNLERVADHCTNIAYFLYKGELSE